jgi:hypothetical protein
MQEVAGVQGALDRAAAGLPGLAAALIISAMIHHLHVKTAL